MGGQRDGGVVVMLGGRRDGGFHHGGRGICLHHGVCSWGICLQCSVGKIFEFEGKIDIKEFVQDTVMMLLSLCSTVLSKKTL